MPDTRAWHFYILQSSDGSFYTGIALDPEGRAAVHSAGKGADYTARRRPVTLAHAEPYPTKSAARLREMQVKRWRAQKKAQLVRGFPRQARDKRIR